MSTDIILARHFAHLPADFSPSFLRRVTITHRLEIAKALETEQMLYAKDDGRLEYHDLPGGSLILLELETLSGIHWRLLVAYNTSKEVLFKHKIGKRLNICVDEPVMPRPFTDPESVVT